MSRTALLLASVLLVLTACTGTDDDPMDAPDDGNAAAATDDEGDADAPDEPNDDAGGTDEANEEPDEAEVEHVPAPPGTIPVRFEAVATGLHVPNDLADLGDGRLLINDQAGTIHLLTPDGLAESPVLDLSDRILPPEGSGGRLELGLSGIAAHPDFADNGRFYALFTEPPPEDAERVARVDVLAEFTASGDPLTADLSLIHI